MYSGKFKTSGINCFWIVNNSLLVLSHFSTLNNDSKAKHLYAFDLTMHTLYT